MKYFDPSRPRFEGARGNAGELRLVHPNGKPLGPMPLLYMEPIEGHKGEIGWYVRCHSGFGGIMFRALGKKFTTSQELFDFLLRWVNDPEGELGRTFGYGWEDREDRTERPVGRPPKPPAKPVSLEDLGLL